MDTDALSRLPWLATGGPASIRLLASKRTVRLMMATHQGLQRMTERGEKCAYQA